MNPHAGNGMTGLRWARPGIEEGRKGASLRQEKRRDAASTPHPAVAGFGNADFGQTPGHPGREARDEDRDGREDYKHDYDYEHEGEGEHDYDYDYEGEGDRGLVED
jgi:hypothetical protein